ncbi:transporter substrate-binding domain-containing protein [Desulfovibrio mangrovi]|uniref:transporter substrate-binding domain-containing protein n=1 Tax=Desulfovibrio mangrovi TaxID=2976983 RepID=UPI0022463E36|nr:transporter substrate-binding domain-containing protein [Desulfovibrio mangrovi]UZP65811.1 transporter substrate-binding domain-containing protein [Desulfovibrio mangrovi]
MEHLLRVRGDYNYPPYEFLEGGVPAGFNVDVMRAVARVKNLNIRIDLGPWSEVRGQIERGEIDILTGMYYSPERDKLVDFSTPHIIVNHAIFVRDDSDINSLDDLEGKSVIVQNGDIMHDFARRTLKKTALVPVESQEDGLALLASGKHDAALLSSLQALYIMQGGKYENVIFVGPPLEPRRYCFVVKEGDEALQAALDEGLLLIKSSGEYAKIHDKWFGVYERRSFKQKLLRIFLFFFVPLLLLLAFFLLWTWSLRKAVRERTEALLESREHFKTLVESCPLGMALVSASGKVLYLNSEFSRMAGYTIEDIPDVEAWWQLAYPDKIYRNRVKGAWKSMLTDNSNDLLQAGNNREWLVTTKSGVVRDVEFRYRRLGADMLVIMADVTERNRTADLLVQSEKLLSVGGLAAGMAHEINNPLGGILQGIQNIFRRVSPDMAANREAAEKAGCSIECIREYFRLRKVDYMLEGIQECGQRAAAIVANMLNFSRKSESHFALNSMPVLVERAISLASAEYDPKRKYDFKSIALVRDFAPDLSPLECSETEIVQVLFNLIHNAAQAIASQTGREQPGRITITIREEEGYIFVDVADNGPGMDTETKRRIFEPFFTTKAPGEGTGLGLSVVFMIVTRNHNGEIRVESAPGGGTIFHVRLPLKHETMDECGPAGTLMEG